MNIIRHRLFATLTAAVLGLAVTGSAQADAFASAILEISNFRLLHGNGTAYASTDFRTITGTNDAHATAQLNSFVVPRSGSAPVLLPTLNLPSACAPANACPAVLATNPFDRLPSPVPGSIPVPGNFGYADQNLLGSAITTPTQAAGVLAQTRADASATVGSIASADSDVGTSTTFQFQLGASDTMTVAFNARPYTEAFVEPGSAIGSNASARLSWSINIVDLSTGDSVFFFAPDEINALSNVSRSGAFPGTTQFNDANQLFSFSATTDTFLDAGTVYQLTIQHNTLADAQQVGVPEPATLAIMATGLLGMAATVRRRRR